MLDVIRRHPHYTFLLLTKDPERLPTFTYPPNVWLGVTVTGQAMVPRAEAALARTNAVVRWLSCEPLLSPVALTTPELLDLIVIGAQTRTRRARALQPDPSWVKALITQAERGGCRIYEKDNLDRLKELPFTAVAPGTPAPATRAIATGGTPTTGRAVARPSSSCRTGTAASSFGA